MAITKTSSASYVIHPLNGDPIILDALNVRIPGNLTVSGTTTSVETTNTEIFDNIIRLNAGHSGAPSLNAGIEVERGDETDVQLRWNEGFQKWQITNDGSVYGNIATAAASGSYITDIVQDLTPQLGGNLDVQTNSIVTTSNRNVLLAPNGTGLVEIKGNDNAGQIQLNCEQNSHGVKIKGPPHSAGQSYTLTLPSSITNDYYLKTDGSGNLSFAAVPTETKPTVADVSQTIAPATATTINITGTNFVTVPIVDFINASTGATTRANTVSFTNATTLSVNLTLASGNYFVRIENPDGNAGRSTNNIITASTAPSFSTAAGSLGTIAAGSSVSLSVAASSDSNVTITETTAVLTSNANGGIEPTRGNIAHFKFWEGQLSFEELLTEKYRFTPLDHSGATLVQWLPLDSEWGTNSPLKDASKKKLRIN